MIDRALIGFLIGLIFFAVDSWGVEEGFALKTKEGFSVQVKINHPKSQGKLPTLIVLGGAGPLNVDMAIVPVNTPNAGCPKVIWKGDCRLDKTMAEELASAGFGVVRMGRRGTWVDESKPYEVKIKWEENVTSTISARVEDFHLLLEALKKYPQLDLNNIYLMGVSEGTVISHLVAKTLGEKVKGIVQVGAVLGNLGDIHRMQAVDVVFGQLLNVSDLNRDGKISKEEFTPNTYLAYPTNYHGFEPTFRDRVLDYKLIKKDISFDYFDLDQSGTLLKEELSFRLYHDLYSPFLASLESETAFRVLPEFSFKYNSFQQFQGWYGVAPIAPELIKTKFPVTLIFGATDMNTPVSQLDSFLPLLWKEKNALVKVSVLDVADGHYGPNLIVAAIGEFKGWLKE